MENFSSTLELLEMAAAADDLDDDVRLLAEKLKFAGGTTLRIKSYTLLHKFGEGAMLDTSTVGCYKLSMQNRRRWPLTRLLKCSMHCHSRLFIESRFYGFNATFIYLLETGKA